MRIISGKFKGRNLVVPKNFLGRPTTDFAREGLFNVLRNLVEMDGLSILDLFAGTGAFGLECLSRGAASAVFVDVQPLHLRFIQDNLRQFDMHNGRTQKQDAFKFIQGSSTTWDIIFADPPYDLPNLGDLPDRVFASECLDQKGIFILEHGKRTSFEGHPLLMQERAYSNVRFSFFQRSDASK